MQALNNFCCGADRKMLLRIYLSVIRPILDYGACIYGSASKSVLGRLDTIQNKSLAIAVGARKTTPVVSLEVEANVPPLYIHRKLVLLKYFARINILPENSPIVREVVSNPKNQVDGIWGSSAFRMPLMKRTTYLFLELQVPVPEPNPTQQQAAYPPWTDPNDFYCYFFYKC